MPRKDESDPPPGGRKQDGSGGGKGRRTNEKGTGKQTGGKKGVKK
jgi:hypothetical protein